MTVLDEPEGRLGPSGNGLSFEEWRLHFFADARRDGLLHNAELLGDAALWLFWRQGVAPTVRALLASAEGDLYGGEKAPEAT